MTARKPRSDWLPIGRPSTFKPEFCEHIVRFCKDGWSITSFAAEISTPREQLNVWAERYPAFDQALKRAKDLGAKWWETQARRMAQRGAAGGQVAMTIFMLKNFGQHDFKERVEHTGADGGPISLETLLLRAEEKSAMKVIDHEPEASDGKPGAKQLPLPEIEDA